MQLQYKNLKVSIPYRDDKNLQKHPLLIVDFASFNPL